MLNSKYHPPGCTFGTFTDQSPLCVTCFFSIHSHARTSRGSSSFTPDSANANTAYAVSHTGDMHGCIRNVGSATPSMPGSRIPNLSNSSNARITCGSSSEYPNTRSAKIEFKMPG